MVATEVDLLIPDTTMVERQESGKEWILYQGDVCRSIHGVPCGSIDYMLFSPPFASLYCYTDQAEDMGNSSDYGEFWEHFQFLIPELYRVAVAGRLCSVHCMNLPTTLQHHGVIGIQDFRGDIIRSFVKAGWVYHSEVCIWKDPVTAMQRTKALGLLHKQLVKDSAMSRMGIPDYVCTFRKPGENAKRVEGELDEWIGDPEALERRGKLSIDIWQRYASPVWSDIRQSRTLNYRIARGERDERHICPLQLDVIERCLELWTNAGDVVFSPFAGIGSEGYSAILRGRRFVGMELKASYFDIAVKNLQRAEAEHANATRTLFD